ncbi:unnamed protein product, partial [Microthlaspi erraticum]
MRSRHRSMPRCEDHKCRLVCSRHPSQAETANNGGSQTQQFPSVRYATPAPDPSIEEINARERNRGG